MKAALIALTVVTIMTVEQRDAHRSTFDGASVAVSANGRFVAFTTYSQLVRADVDNSSDVYVLDREQQRVTLESANTPGPFKGDSSDPRISGNGRFVVFGRGSGILVRDRSEGITRTLAGARQPSISEDGRIITFAASTLKEAEDADVNGHRGDIYASDVALSRTRRVSIDMNGLNPSFAVSIHPSASGDGRFVAFAARLQQDRERPRNPKVFVRDTHRNTTRLIGAGWDPSISGDGRFVAFAGPVNRVAHIFLADLLTGETRVITNSMRGELANGESAKPKISSDGRFVAFQSEASDLIAAKDFNLLWDVFVFDRITGAISLISGDADGAWMEPSAGPSISARGTVVAFSSRHPTDVTDNKNDFDLYVANVADLKSEARKRDGSWRTTALGVRDFLARPSSYGAHGRHAITDPLRHEHTTAGRWLHHPPLFLR